VARIGQAALDLIERIRVIEQRRQFVKRLGIRKQSQDWLSKQQGLAADESQRTDDLQQDGSDRHQSPSVQPRSPCLNQFLAPGTVHSRKYTTLRVFLRNAARR
jgi:hypothetical protein